MYIIAHFSEKEKKKQCRFQIGIYRSLSAEGAKASPWGEAGKNL
jgi:hypothetical protein